MSRERYGRRKRFLLIVGAAVVMGLALWHYLMAGHAEAFRYARPSPYVLPWQSGTSHMCAQGNNSRASHRGDKYAGSWDFFMLPGTPISAARAGIVESVEKDHGDWPGLRPGNVITVRHDDGSLAVYGHLRGAGMNVRPGAFVRQRQLIGEAGLSGPTAFPHVHFHVEDRNGRGIFVSFSDVDGTGVPRLWGVYRAGVSR